MEVIKSFDYSFAKPSPTQIKDFKYKNNIMRNNSNWKATNDRYFAYLQLINILGVSEELFNELLDTLSDIDNTSTISGQTSSKRAPSYLNLVKTIMLSNRIVLVSRDMSNDSVVHFLGSAMRLQLLLLQHGIAIKGGIGQGIITFDHCNLIVTGLPVIEAIKNSEIIQFYGVAENTHGLSNDPTIRDIQDDDIPLTYPTEVPTSEGSKPMSVLNISIAVKKIEDVENMHRTLADNAGASIFLEQIDSTIKVFRKAFTYSFLDRSVG